MAKKPHIITMGNQKGGSGKSTTTVHLAVALQHLGFEVGVIDLDGDQATTSRYLENRRDHMQAKGLELPVPQCVTLKNSALRNRDDAEAEEQEAIAYLINALGDCDFILIDTPGADTHLSRAGHSFADTLVTPLNDSFIDLDLFARINGDTLNIETPSQYADMVWQQRARRHQRDRGKVDWVVVRNRMQTLDARNKRQVGKLLDDLAKRYTFRPIAGFGERVIYKELFLKGLTLLDAKKGGLLGNVTMSHVAARAELRNLIEHLNLPGMGDKLKAL